MRLKFFLTIFFVLSLTAASISSIHFHFFKTERMRLIELNLEQNANLLKNTDLQYSRSEFSGEGRKVIENIIGDDKVNMIVAIYNDRGRVLYRNDNARVFNIPESIPLQFTEWDDVESGEYLIKYLTIKDQEQGRVIRVGMILNQSLLRWKYLNQRITLFASIILMVITLISFFLTYILFRPVQLLAEQVNLMGEKIERGEFKDIRSWFDIIGKQRGGNDEFNKLIGSLDRLAQKITETQHQTQRWTALMAHELKTPMTILKNSIENLTLELKHDESKVRAVENELDRLEMIVTDFLEWASLENDTERPVLHALLLGKRSEQLYQVMKSAYPAKSIELNCYLKEEKRIFCNPIHFDQVINNLLINALKYGEKALLEVREDSISIQDNGPGIPESVLDNFGRPFNKFHQGRKEGYGLGLAWVNTICKKYNWKITFNNDTGTKINIFFADT